MHRGVEVALCCRRTCIGEISRPVGPPQTRPGTGAVPGRRRRRCRTARSGAGDRVFESAKTHCHGREPWPLGGRRSRWGRQELESVGDPHQARPAATRDAVQGPGPLLPGQRSRGRWRGPMQIDAWVSVRQLATRAECRVTLVARSSARRSPTVVVGGREARRRRCRDPGRGRRRGAGWGGSRAASERLIPYPHRALGGQTGQGRRPSAAQRTSPMLSPRTARSATPREPPNRTRSGPGRRPRPSPACTAQPHMEEPRVAGPSVVEGAGSRPGAEYLEAGHRSEHVGRKSEATGRAGLAGMGDMAGGAQTG